MADLVAEMLEVLAEEWKESGKVTEELRRMAGKWQGHNRK